MRSTLASWPANLSPDVFQICLIIDLEIIPSRSSTVPVHIANQWILKMIMGDFAEFAEMVWTLPKDEAEHKRRASNLRSVQDDKAM